jgi:hypothetical protein
MKTFKEYLAESKKVYDFKIKVAGELPEKFQENLKEKLGRCGVKTLEKIATTPIQALPLDFPEKTNCEVTIFELVCEYPVTSPEIINDIKSMGLSESDFRVRGSNEPTESEQVLAAAESSGKALLDDAQYKEADKIKVKDYFGDDFNKSFLKDLEKTAKASKKERGIGEYKLAKTKTTGSASPMTKIANPEPVKGK